MTIVYIISAPSGSGKSTLVNEVRRLVPGLDFSVSYTTRSPRGSEQDGREYFFVSRAEFTTKIRKGEFLEHAEFDGNMYGTSRRFLREATQRGHDLVLDIDVQGAKQIRQQLTDAVSIFILPPNRQTLEWRLRNRSQDQEDVIQRRLVTNADEKRPARTRAGLSARDRNRAVHVAKPGLCCRFMGNGRQHVGFIHDTALNHRYFCGIDIIAGMHHAIELRAIE